jgi:hypothetical protein
MDAMVSPTLLVLAAGLGSRYGGLKQLDPVGPDDETIMDYSIFDARRAGFGKVVFVIRKEIEEPFKTTLGARYEKRVPVEYVFQEVGKLIPGFSIPEGRSKPWGTTHAILMASNVIHEPFAVINADDFYGAESFRVLSQHLQTGSSDYAMVGFVLRNTLSEFGTVARGVCHVAEDGFLKDIMELKSIEREGPRITNIDAEGQETVLIHAASLRPALRAVSALPETLRKRSEGGVLHPQHGQYADPVWAGPRKGVALRGRVVRGDLPRGSSAGGAEYFEVG